MVLPLSFSFRPGTFSALFCTALFFRDSSIFGALGGLDFFIRRGGTVFRRFSSFSVDEISPCFALGFALFYFSGLHRFSSMFVGGGYFFLDVAVSFFVDVRRALSSIFSVSFFLDISASFSVDVDYSFFATFSAFVFWPRRIQSQILS